MCKSIIEELYYGRINIFGRQEPPDPERSRLQYQIEEEKKYLMEKLPLEDRPRFEALDRLFLQANLYEEQICFSLGLRFGILFMHEVFQNETLYPEPEL